MLLIQKAVTAKPAATMESQMQEAAAYIHARIGQTKTNIIEVGDKLLEIKNLVGHGKFGDWVDAEFGMSARTASRYMLASKKLKAISDTVSDLPTKLLHILAAPSTPEAIKSQVIDEIQKGAIPSVQSVAEMIQQARISKAGHPPTCDPKLVNRLRKIGLDAACAALTEAFPGMDFSVEFADLKATSEA